MDKTSRAKVYVGVFFVVLFTMFTLVYGIAVAQESAASDIQNKLDGISVKERETLEKLFIQEQMIEDLENAKKENGQAMGAAKVEMDELQRSISDEVTAYKIKTANLNQIFKSYQRMGAGSYLEIILRSEGLADFLRRINTLRDLIGRTGDLLEQIRKSRQNLALEKLKLTDKLNLIENKQLQIQESMIKIKQLKKEQEEYLLSLSAEKGTYQAYLSGMQQKWEEIIPLFSNTMKALPEMVQNGEFPRDAFKVSFSFFRVYGSISDQSLNQIIAGNPSLPKMFIGFKKNNVEISMPNERLVLQGLFVIVEGHILQFQVKEAQFYGMPLGATRIEELMQKGNLSIDLKQYLGKAKLHAIEVKDGTVELTVVP